VLCYNPPRPIDERNDSAIVKAMILTKLFPINMTPKVIGFIKNDLPDANLLLTSVSDNCYRRTPSGTPKKEAERNRQKVFH